MLNSFEAGFVLVVSEDYDPTNCFKVTAHSIEVGTIAEVPYIKEASDIKVDCLDRNFMGIEATDIASFIANVEIVLSIDSIVVVSTANTTDITFAAGNAFAVAIKGSSDMLASDFNSEELDLEHSVC